LLRFTGEHKGSVVVGIAAYAIVFVAGGDEEVHDIVETILGSEVKRSVGLVGDVGAGEGARVRAGDAADKREVVKEDCAPEADRDVDPVSTCQCRCLAGLRGVSCIATAWCV